MKNLVQALTLSLIFSLSASALAANVPPSGEYLNKDALKRAYKENCVKNIRALKKMLLENHTKFEGTIKSAGLSEDLNCNLENDPIFENLQNDEKIAKTEKIIKKMGSKVYIDKSKKSLADVYSKYSIEELNNKAESGLITQDEFNILLSYAKTKSCTDSIIATLNDYKSKTANNIDSNSENSDNAEAL